MTVAAVALAATVPFVYCDLARFAPWVAWVLFFPGVAACLFTGPVVFLTGGPLPIWGLARTSREIQARWHQMAAVNHVTSEDPVWLVKRSKELDRWRLPETSELIDLYQLKIADLLASGAESEGFAERAALRNARIEELLERLYGHRSNL